MNVGFETVGNASVICHDGRPVLVTDPWLKGSAYFGSWGMSHEVPEEQLNAAFSCEYFWISHGHPDHLSLETIALMKNKKLLLPDHEGGRMANELRELGFDVTVLKDRTWVQLSPRIRILCIADYNQDGILLIEIDGRLVVNLNDSNDRGWSGFVRDQIKRYSQTFLLALTGYGDADMINYFREDGSRITPYAAAKTPVGQKITRLAELYGTRYFVPFSSMHRFQRDDSIWADEYTTRLDDYARGFTSKSCELLPAFIRFDCEKDRLERLDPPAVEDVVYSSREFGDDWSEQLEPEEVRQLEAYFRSFEHLGKSMDFINFRVGGKEHSITFANKAFNKGLTFDAPRGSLMKCVTERIFDDMLIGNYMRTMLHGDWGELKLYPDFTPYVGKYGDNGQARTEADLTAYFEAYRKRDPIGHLRHTFDTHCVRPLQQKSANILREKLGGDSPMFRVAKEAYWLARKHLG